MEYSSPSIYSSKIAMPLLEFLIATVTAFKSSDESRTILQPLAPILSAGFTTKGKFNSLAKFCKSDEFNCSSEIKKYFGEGNSFCKKHFRIKVLLLALVAASNECPKRLSFSVT